MLLCTPLKTQYAVWDAGEFNLQTSIFEFQMQEIRQKTLQTAFKQQAQVTMMINKIIIEYMKQYKKSYLAGSQ